MGSRYEVEVTISSARDLKNVNWRDGDLKPYVVVWIDPAAKASTKADFDGGVAPAWDEKLTLAVPADQSIDDAVLSVDVVHAGSAEGVKPLVGSARLPLREVVDEAGVGGKCARSLKLKRPSGRPQGKLDLKVRVAVKEQPRSYYDPNAAPPYGAAAPRDGPPYAGGYGQGSRDVYGQPYGGGGYAAPPAGYPYSAPPPGGYGYGAPPPQPAGGYGYGTPAGGYGYGAPPPQAAGGYGYGAPPTQGYGAPPPGEYGGYGGSSQAAAGYVDEGKKKSKFGMGTGLAVGAAAGILGGIALVEGAEYVEDKIADDAADRVEDDLGYEDDY